MIRFSTLVLLTVASPAGRTADSCLAYEPAPIRLVGHLIHRDLPGPPHYESIRDGDASESVFFIVLSRPVCVSADSTSEVNGESEFALDTIQVGPVDSRWESFRRLVGRQVEVRGTLFHQINGHHRTRIVMSVEAIKRADR